MDCSAIGEAELMHAIWNTLKYSQYCSEADVGTRRADHYHQSSLLTNYIIHAVRQAGGMRLAKYVEDGGKGLPGISTHERPRNIKMTPKGPEEV